MAKVPLSLNAGTFFRAFQSGLRPRPQLSGSQWADAYRIVAAGTSAEPGRWHTDRVPYMREIMDAAASLDHEKIVIMAASQVGKSELLLNMLGYYIEREPAPILMIYPTDEMAEAFSKERIAPMIRSTPELASKFDTAKDPTRGMARKSSDTIREKTFAGGQLALVGTGSPNKLATRPIRVVLCDEIDRYLVSKEGDPITLAVQRTETFANRKIILVSTPTFDRRDDMSCIAEEFEKSDKREYLGLCQHCGERFKFEWHNVKWQMDDDGQVIESSIGFFCPHCSARLRGGERIHPDLLKSGQWTPTNSQGRFPGYHLTALCSPWVRLSDLVHRWLEVHRDRDQRGLQEFMNLKLGEPYVRHSVAVAWERLMARCEMYPTDANGAECAPDGVQHLTAGIDVQRDRLECSVYGWGAKNECWLIEHYVLAGDPLLDDVWRELDNVLLNTPRHTASGTLLRLWAAFVDSADGRTTAAVYAYTKPRETRRIVACKGMAGAVIDGSSRQLVRKYSYQGDNKAILYSVGVDAAKELIMDRLTIDTPGPGYVHFPAGHIRLTGEFFQQLTSETQQASTDASGRRRLKWIKLRDRNEALDCLVYATAAHELFMTAPKRSRAPSRTARKGLRA